MNDDTPFRNLHFANRTATWPRRLIPVGIALTVFTILWVLVPASALYWLLLPLVALAVWVASYGWRKALLVVHDLLHQVSNF